MVFAPLRLIEYGSVDHGSQNCIFRSIVKFGVARRSGGGALALILSGSVKSIVVLIPGGG